mmetsp:Transcript_42171/g.98922  ORF Transcript_42171/g.98922 Transcript_42171/m.98922 type:complete len:272 (-) Transcript_42171:325-1140(-)
MTRSLHPDCVIHAGHNSRAGAASIAIQHPHCNHRGALSHTHQPAGSASCAVRSVTRAICIACWNDSARASRRARVGALTNRAAAASVAEQVTVVVAVRGIDEVGTSHSAASTGHSELGVSCLHASVHNIYVDTSSIVLVLISAVNSAIYLVEAPRNIFLESLLIHLWVQANRVILFTRLAAWIIQDILQGLEVHLGYEAVQGTKLIQYSTLRIARRGDFLGHPVHMLDCGLSIGRLAILQECTNVCIHCIGIFRIPHAQLAPPHERMQSFC